MTGRWGTPAPEGLARELGQSGDQPRLGQELPLVAGDHLRARAVPPDLKRVAPLRGAPDVDERLTVIGHADRGRRGAPLLVADGAGPALRYRCVVELGLARDELWEALAPLERAGCPLAWTRPPRRVTWVAPELVEVSCHGKGGQLREATVQAVYPSR